MDTKQFLEYILSQAHPQSYSLHQAVLDGVVTNTELAAQNSPLSRKNAARILHEIMLHLLKEPDVADWSGAWRLRDLTSCHTCVAHIAQVYVKGILPPASEALFGGDSLLTPEDALASVERLFSPEKRISVAPSTQCSIQYLTNEQLSDYPGIQIIDVRPAEEYHAFGSSRNIPYEELYLNPYQVSADKNTPILLLCKMGYKSVLAAKLLIEYGYTNVFVGKPSSFSDSSS